MEKQGRVVSWIRKRYINGCHKKQDLQNIVQAKRDRGEEETDLEEKRMILFIAKETLTCNAQ
jgi:hypothetical protein